MSQRHPDLAGLGRPPPCAASIPSASAAASRIASASRYPCSPVAAFAFPELTTAARIALASQSSRQTRTGAAAAALRVRSSAERTLRVAGERCRRRWRRRLQAAGGAGRRKPGPSWARVELLDSRGRVDPARAQEHGRWRLADRAGGASREPLGLRQAQHQVQVLDRLAGRALPEVVDRAEGDEPPPDSSKLIRPPVLWWHARPSGRRPTEGFSSPWPSVIMVGAKYRAIGGIDARSSVYTRSRPVGRRNMRPRAPANETRAADRPRHSARARCP